MKKLTFPIGVLVVSCFLIGRINYKNALKDPNSEVNVEARVRAIDAQAVECYDMRMGQTTPRVWACSAKERQTIETGCGGFRSIYRDVPVSQLEGWEVMMLETCRLNGF